MVSLYDNNGMNFGGGGAVANQGGQGFLGTALGALGGPIGMGIATIGGGLLQGFLGGNAQKSFYDDMNARITAASSEARGNQIYGNLVARNAGSFNQLALDQRMLAQNNADSSSAAFSRAGLSGIGESQKRSADIGAYLKGRSARDAYKLELQQLAGQQQNREVAAIQSLMQTPYGSVSPASSALAGAGSGMEAFVNARYADQMAGRSA